MAMGAVHPRVLGYLGRALSLELSAVQQYMTQASLVELWGLQEEAARFRAETVEEMQHAERIVQRMLAVGVAPAASQLRPVTHAADLVGLLRLNAGCSRLFPLQPSSASKLRTARVPRSTGS
jgi:bacterioferritin